MIDPVIEPSQPSASTAKADKALSFISRGWREVRNSAGADLQLMRARAATFKNLATSFDRELENFLNSASSFQPPPPPPSSPAELEFVKRLQPKLSEFRRAYSSPDFSRKVLQKWSPRARIRIDLSAIKKAIVSEVEDTIKVIDFDADQVWRGQKRVGEKELERKSVSSEIFGYFNSKECVEKVKAALVCVFSLVLPCFALGFGKLDFL